jgi:hypothetical protein
MRVTTRIGLSGMGPKFGGESTQSTMVLRTFAEAGASTCRGQRKMDASWADLGRSGNRRSHNGENQLSDGLQLTRTLNFRRQVHSRRDVGRYARGEIL